MLIRTKLRQRECTIVRTYYISVDVKLVLYTLYRTCTHVNINKVYVYSIYIYISIISTTSVPCIHDQSGRQLLV